LKKARAEGKEFAKDIKDLRYEVKDIKLNLGMARSRAALVKKHLKKYLKRSKAID